MTHTHTNDILLWFHVSHSPGWSSGVWFNLICQWKRKSFPSMGPLYHFQAVINLKIFKFSLTSRLSFGILTPWALGLVFPEQVVFCALSGVLQLLSVSFLLGQTLCVGLHWVPLVGQNDSTSWVFNQSRLHHLGLLFWLDSHVHACQLQ